MEKQSTVVRFICRPVYVDGGPDYCLIFDKVNPTFEHGNTAPNFVIKYSGPIDAALRKFFHGKLVIAGWGLARPYFADREDVAGYRRIALAV